MSDAIPERWLPIAGYEDLYEVSNLGRVRGIRKSGKGARPTGPDGTLKPALDGSGYRFVGLSRNRKNVIRKVHVLVLEAFTGPRPSDLHQARHLNGDRTCNEASNLAWGTASENQLDTVRHGTHRWSRYTRCTKGHEYTPENTFRRSDGGRRCLTCKRANERVTKARIRARNKAGAA